MRREVEEMKRVNDDLEKRLNDGGGDAVDTAEPREHDTSVDRTAAAERGDLADGDELHAPDSSQNGVRARRRP